MKAKDGWALWAAGAGVFIGTFDMAALSVSLPRLMQAWHLTALAAGALGSTTLFGMIVGALAAGTLADRYGRRGILVADFITYGLAAVGSALAPNIGWLAVFRGLVGVGIGADYAVAFPYLVEEANPDERGRVMAWAMWAANFGMLCAYAVSSLVVDQEGGWRLPLVFGAALVLPLLILRHRLPESQIWSRRRLASISSIVRTLAMSLEERRALSVSAINWFSYQVSDQGLTLFLPLMLAQTLGTSVASAAWHSVLVKAVTIPAALVTVGVIDRIGRRPLQVWGFLGRAVTLLILGWLVLDPQASKNIELALLMATYAIGALGPDKTTVITPAEQFRPEVRGTGQAVAESVGRIGGIVGVVGYGLVSTQWGVGAALFFLGGATLLGWGVSWRLLPETRGQTEEANLPAVAKYDGP